MKRWLKRECLNIIFTVLILSLMTWAFIAFNTHVKNLVSSAREEERQKIRQEQTDQKQQPIILEVTATAYSSHYQCTGKTPSHPAYGITKSGTKATEGRTIAVDPEVIPLGSTVYINGQVFIAEDTGSLIKGKRIDIYMQDYNSALNFGKQIIEIEVKE